MQADTSSFTDETGVITVTGGALSYLLIRDGSNGGGAEVGAVTLTTDESLILYAAGYDADDNYISAVDASWQVTGDLDAVPASGESTPSTAPTTGTITVSSAGLTGAVTGTVTVNVGVLDNVLVEDAAGGLGSAVDAVEITTDSTLTFYLVAIKSVLVEKSVPVLTVPIDPWTLQWALISRM